MGYTHLSQEERYQIYGLLKAEKSLSEIAADLERSKSTISREISRNRGGRGYRPKQAQAKADCRQSEAFKAFKMTNSLKKKIAARLRQYWSPEQISGYLLKQEDIFISHTTIYDYIFENKKNGGVLYKHLRCQKKRKKRYGSTSIHSRGQIKNRVSIEQRPSIVEEKSRVGDWEGDTVIGKNHQGAIVTLVDRKSKLVLMAKVERRDADSVAIAINRLLSGRLVHTITVDNGKEFSKHEHIAEVLKTKVYFANPYSSWERGLNENTNGLIRQYFKKGSSFKNVDSTAIELVMKQLNTRPRKGLDFRTPQEVYLEGAKLKGVALVT